MDIAVITGVTSGLGLEFLKQVTTKYPDLEQIWVIARRKDRLENICNTFNFNIKSIALDLTQKQSIAEFSNILEQTKPNIKILINNAGFGELGEFYNNNLDSQMSMIDLNNRALTAMCTVSAKYMNKGSFIVNVSSIASFAPNIRMAVYSSTKAYVTSFTRCIREELKPKKINALAVCPGPMATEFLSVAGITGGKSKTFEILPYCKPERVAKKAIERAAKGKGMYTPTPFYKFYRILAKALPHSLVMKLCKT